MKHSDGGKGDAPRKQQNQKAYDDGWDRIFGKKPKEKPIKEEPLEKDECND
jgi:hypothetical protein